MSQTILIKRGDLSSILSDNTSLQGELLLSLNTKELYLVTDSGKHLVGKCYITTSNNMPAQHIPGRIIYQSDTDYLFIDNGSTFTKINSYNTDLLNNKPGSYYLDRTNHTGTQTSDTISDFNDAAVSACKQYFDCKQWKNILFEGVEAEDGSVSNGEALVWSDNPVHFFKSIVGGS